MRIVMRAAAALALLAVCAPVARASAPQAAWVELTAAGVEVRAVADAGCPSLMVDGHAVAMAARAGPRAGFNQWVCQAVLPAGAKHASIAGRALPVPAGPPKRILIFGDTGCRLKGLATQDCNNPRAWPFARVAQLAARQKPDLVIHVGDYYYRETPCPDRRADCAGSPYGDQWATWRAEFFDPAQPLLATAPWVFARGNHESCVRGGLGWFRLLDAAPRPAVCPALSAPFRVDLGDLNLYVVDSADADDRFATSEGVQSFADQLKRLEPDLARRPGWIVTHRPIWGLAPIVRLGPVGPLELSINRTEQLAVQTKDLSAVRMVVSGHIHHFAAYAFGPSRPSQLIVGTGGDVGERFGVATVHVGADQIDSQSAQGVSFQRFGYFLLDREGEDWVGAFRDLDDHLIARCRLRARRLSCAPVGAPVG